MEQQTEIMPHTNGVRRVLSINLHGLTNFDDAKKYMEDNYWNCMGFQSNVRGFKIYEITLAQGADDMPQIWFLGKEGSRIPMYAQFVPQETRIDEYDKTPWTMKCAVRLAKTAYFYETIAAYFYDLENRRRSNAGDKKAQKGA